MQNKLLGPVILALVLTTATGISFGMRSSKATWIPASVRSGSSGGGGFIGGGFSGGK